MNLKNIYFPVSVKEAVSLLKRKNSFFMASSTFSFKEMNKDIENIVLAKNLPLKHIKKDADNLMIGALATFEDMENHPLCKKLFGGFLSSAASACSSQLIRNMATVGGNIAHPNAFNLMPLIASVMNAKIKIADAKGFKIVEFSKIYDKNLKIGKTAIITEILIPLKYAKQTFYFEKVSKISSSWESYVTCAFRSEIKNGLVKDIKLVFSAVRALPFSSVELENKVIGKKLDLKLIEEIASSYGNLIADFNRNSKSTLYKSKVAKNLAAHYLKTVMEAK